MVRFKQFLIASFARRPGSIWLRAGCLGVGLAGLGVAIFLSVKSSPSVARIHWLPAWLGHWADRHGRLCNFPAYAVLSVPFLAACAGTRGRLRVSLVLTLLVGLLEVAQIWIPTRCPDLWDLICGGAGIFAAQGIFELWSRCKAGWRNRRSESLAERNSTLTK